MGGRYSRLPAGMERRVWSARCLMCSLGLCES
jgi:hypothetical protein